MAHRRWPGHSRWRSRWRSFARSSSLAVAGGSCSRSPAGPRGGPGHSRWSTLAPMVQACTVTAYAITRKRWPRSCGRGLFELDRFEPWPVATTSTLAKSRCSWRCWRWPGHSRSPTLARANGNGHGVGIHAHLRSPVPCCRRENWTCNLDHIDVGRVIRGLGTVPGLHERASGTGQAIKPLRGKHRHRKPL